jgi:hypothetical protein
MGDGPLEHHLLIVGGRRDGTTGLSLQAAGAEEKAGEKEQEDAAGEEERAAD